MDVFPVPGGPTRQRIGLEPFYARRGGPAYIPHVWKFKAEQLRRGYFTFFQFLGTTIPHVLVCLVPNSVRSFIYTHLLRKGTNND